MNHMCSSDLSFLNSLYLRRILGIFRARHFEVSSLRRTAQSTDSASPQGYRSNVSKCGAKIQGTGWGVFFGRVLFCFFPPGISKS